MLHEQTELSGTVQQGVIVPDDGAELTEGQTVKIIVERTEGLPSKPFVARLQEFAGPAEGAAPQVARKAASPLAEMLLKYAGVIDDLPADIAKNHDHYLYGTPKVDEP
jgi:hypothetical protein